MTKNNIEFILYTALTILVILNDKLSFYNLVFSFIYVLYCSYYAVKVVLKSKPARMILYFSLVYILYAICSPSILGSLNSKWGMLNWELKVMLSFFPAYYFSRKGAVTENALRLAGIAMFMCAVISYYLNINLIILNSVADEGGMTNNVGYLFVCILPLLFTNYRKNLVFIVLSYIFVLICLKRGAILCSVFTLPLFFSFFRKKFKINRLVLLFIILMVGLISAYFMYDFIQQNEYVAKRVELTLEGNSSGRDDIYQTMWSGIKKYSADELLLGKGINYSMIISGGYAHNDWLEILSSMGILGCIFYTLSFYGMFLCCRRYCCGDYRYVGYMIIVIALIRTGLSMNYFSLDSLPLYYTMGLICYKGADISKKENHE